MSGSSIVQRGKRWAVVCYAGIDPESKKQRQKWFSGFATRKEAEHFRLSLAHHPVFGAGAGPYSNPRLRTGDYLNSWLRERETLGTLRENTVSLSKIIIHSYLEPYLGHIPLSRLSPATIQQLYVNLLNRGLKPSSVRRITGVLHSALDEAMKRGLIARNPQDNTSPPKVHQYKPGVPTVEQVERYLADAYKTATPTLYALYVTAATCGLRIGELTSLPADGVDLTAGVLHINDLRHFHATHLIAAGVDYRTVGDRMGHSSPAFTLATYAHATAQAQERAAIVANGLLTNKRVLN